MEEEYYDEEEYIRSYEDFVAYQKTKEEEEA